jgi:N-acetylneuraminate synthase
MQCTTAYPCPPERVGLNIIAEMRARYGVTIGFSDHTTGMAASFAAAALGADVIEKHLTFSRLMYGSDAANAMEPADFRQMADGLGAIWAMRAAPVDKDDLTPYREMKPIFEKSVVTARPIPADRAIERGDLAFKKPGDGISASRYRELIGKRAKRDLPAEHKLSEADLA